MCTVTWWLAPDAGRYEIFFNRDELRSRGLAGPPVLSDQKGVSYLAPVDADHGGTWLLINAFGVTLGLVNHYPAGAAAPALPRLSRGQLLRDLADVPGASAVGDRLAKAPLNRCPSFYLVAFGLAEAPRRWRWDTHALHDESDLEPWPFLTGSSYESSAVPAHRRAIFIREWAERGRLAPADLAHFHRYREASRPAWGVLMDRPDARTVSYSHLTIGPAGEAVFAYSSRPPADGAPPAPAVIARLPLRKP
jgi:hypothetical protein